MIVINPQFYGAYNFSEGLACVKDSKEGKWGYVDKAGKIVISHQFNLPDDFHGGLSYVRVGNYKTGTIGYINKAGKFIWQQM